MYRRTKRESVMMRQRMSLSGPVTALLLLACLGMFIEFAVPLLLVPASAEETPDLASLAPEKVLSTLDLSRPGLAAVGKAEAAGDHGKALRALLQYYREKYPPAPTRDIAGASRKEADDIVNHIFQWGPYESADYGGEVRWDWDPRGDIEWVAAMYRFHWADPLAQAFAETGDPKYGQAFVELTRDWIVKHPLEERDKAHYVYEHWEGFAWLDIQTGIRATRLCQAFPVMVHADAFTPEFLERFLASLYDHQVKTERYPMGKVHNKAVFEQRGFVNIAYTFPEFRDAPLWMALAMERQYEAFMAQVTPDGVQREWSGGYHTGVLRDAVEIMERMDAGGVPVPEDYRQRILAMYDYIFGIATPELAYPMFGDTSRGIEKPAARSQCQLYSELIKATELFGDPKYAARGTLDYARLPEQGCYAFRDAGMYALRDTWGPDQIYLALHCSPPAISGHDQPDNGTFELCAFGRWLMTDSGYYTYGHDPEARAWHRRTRVHQTLTLDGKDTAMAGKSLLWHTEPELTVVAVENASYPDLTHRRTVFFVDNRFFVLLDEAIGNAHGCLDLHFQFAPGEITIDKDVGELSTTFDDANVCVRKGASISVTIEEEEGWFGWTYGKRVARPAVRFRHDNPAPAYFLTLIVPYPGVGAPVLTAVMDDGYLVGADKVSLTVQEPGKTYALGRDLKQQKAWCNR